MTIYSIDVHLVISRRNISDVLEYVANKMSPLQVSAIVLESSISQDGVLHQKYVALAQKYAYANDVKELIVNTSRQLLRSNMSY